MGSYRPPLQFNCAAEMMQGTGIDQQPHLSGSTESYGTNQRPIVGVSGNFQSVDWMTFSIWLLKRMPQQTQIEDRDSTDITRLVYENSQKIVGEGIKDKKDKSNYEDGVKVKCIPNYGFMYVRNKKQQNLFNDQN